MRSGVFRGGDGNVAGNGRHQVRKPDNGQPLARTEDRRFLRSLTPETLTHWSGADTERETEGSGALSQGP